MVRQTKTQTQSAAPVASAEKVKSGKKADKAVVAAPVVVQDKPEKASRKKAAAAPVAPVVDAPATEEPVAEPQLDSKDASAKLLEFGAALQSFGAMLATMKTQYKALEKVVAKELKAAQKSASRKNKKSGNRKPSGFVKPCLISDELAVFLGKELGSEMARTNASKEINNYVKEHSLKDKDNGRIIHPDAKLTALLRIPTNEELTYFNLQKYMKVHFIKSVPAEPLVV